MSWDTCAGPPSQSHDIQRPQPGATHSSGIYVLAIYSVISDDRDQRASTIQSRKNFQRPPHPPLTPASDPVDRPCRQRHPPPPKKRHTHSPWDTAPTRRPSPLAFESEPPCSPRDNPVIIITERDGMSDAVYSHTVTDLCLSVLLRRTRRALSVARRQLAYLRVGPRE